MNAIPETTKHTINIMNKNKYIGWYENIKTYVFYLNTHAGGLLHDSTKHRPHERIISIRCFHHV